ncbi:MAG: hypothetical protein EOO07_08085 [Chitinophagaceae bacterium]|nr:MAG: hypothetical protein EOO07_08085 [Chitinophagaceae bacterium]
MKTPHQQAGTFKPNSVDNSQLDVKFKDGKLTQMNIIRHNDERQLHAENPGLIDETTIANENIYFRNGELHLTAENTSLVDEIKILIRKLWN